MAKLTNQEIKKLHVEFESRLLCVLSELEMQKNVAASYAPNFLSYSNEMKQIREFIDVAGEYELAYEYLVGTIEFHPFVLSGKAAISLLEVALLLNYKSNQPKDKLFDKR